MISPVPIIHGVAAQTVAVMLRFHNVHKERRLKICSLHFMPKILHFIHMIKNFRILWYTGLYQAFADYEERGVHEIRHDKSSVL